MGNKHPRITNNLNTLFIIFFVLSVAKLQFFVFPSAGVYTPFATLLSAGVTPPACLQSVAPTGLGVT
jgi:hypothetical protein